MAERNFIGDADDSLPRSSCALHVGDSKGAVFHHNGIHRYLVRYGTLGWVTLFGSTEPIECKYKDRVVIQTTRGLEVGEFLSRPTDQSNTSGDQPTGELLRRTTAEDERQAAQLRAEPDGLIDDCHRLFVERDLPMEVVECERLFDGKTTVLYFLGEQVPELEAIAARLMETNGSAIRFCPIIDPPPGSRECGGGNCDNGPCELRFSKHTQDFPCHGNDGRWL